jgi:RNase H-fold protein (predicted Holliday junction resolvase)
VEQPSPLALAIDPGSDKCGVAVASRSGEIAFRSIVPTRDLVETVRSLVARYRPIHVVCGKGTGSKQILLDLAAAIELPISPIDEAYTSEAARRRYVAENPPRGLEVLMPRSLRSPRVPYDDYVAVILAERFWNALDAAE